MLSALSMALVRPAAAGDVRADFDLEITPDIQAVLDAISADSLRGHLSFIASDMLAGRDTPSPGLDIAAEYIAAHFRRAGLEPAGDDGYFQTANWEMRLPAADDFRLVIRAGVRSITTPLDQASVQASETLEIGSARLFKVDYADADALAALTADEVGGKVVFTEAPDVRNVGRDQRREVFMAQRAFGRRMAELNVAMVLFVDRVNAAGTGFGRPALIDPENPFPRGGFRSGVPQITSHHPDVVALYDRSAPGDVDATVSASIGEAVGTPVKLRNVIGLLPGSDPALKDTYVLITGHYDHVGVRADLPAGEDNIFNGANDDGSGTVSVMELAAALSRLEPRPRRSIIFMCVFGEEKGLLGSRFYGRHPVFPIEKTVADVNLEQVGRTDSTEGPQIGNASLTGIDFSEVGEIFMLAGEKTDISVYKHERNSDAFFGRSDNQALADQGVPAHTICVAYEYPDYHGAGDHWDKVDYENMAAVNRMVALGILMIANADAEPRWNADNEKAARYIEAWRERRGIQTPEP